MGAVIEGRRWLDPQSGWVCLRALRQVRQADAAEVEPPRRANHHRRQLSPGVELFLLEPITVW